MELILEGNKILHKRAKRVDKIDDKIRNIAASMIGVMNSNNGIGISGPQCGILKRIIVILMNQEPRVMINPEIISQSEDLCEDKEGCLSFPGIFLNILRPSSIKVKYRSLSGHPHLETYEGLTARIIQHEIDHLSGIVFLDRK